MKRYHPSRGWLRAYLDGELAAWRRLLVRVHVARCEACLERLHELREATRATSALMAQGGPALDLHDEWGRFVARSGGARRPARRRLALVASLAVVAVGASAWLVRPWESSECEILPAVDGGPPTIGRMAVRDVCCGDYDGGGHDDDGVLTLSSADESVRFVIVYEDADGDGAFSLGDIQRFRSSRACPSSWRRSPKGSGGSREWRS